MTAKHLSEREDWQQENLKEATLAEVNTFSLLQNLGDTYKIVAKPKVKEGKMKKAIVPELMITNLENSKRLAIEDKKGNNGGNAHERGSKNFTRKRYRLLKENGISPFIIFHDKTFAAKEPFTITTKSGKIKKVNPQLYRDDLEDTYEDEEYFIMELDRSNEMDLIKKIKGLLS